MIKKLKLFSFNFVILSILLISLFGCSTQYQFSEIPGAIKNLDQVDYNVFRGSQPNYLGITSLINNRFTMVINLVDSNEEWNQEEILFDKNKIKYIRMPMKGVGTPPKEQIETILSMIEEEVKNNGRIFIHCEYGKDRTGTIIACYQIRYHKYSNKQAQLEADMYGMSKLEFGMRNFIRHFQ